MMRKRLESFLADRTGATAIEYGLIAGLVAVGLVAGFGGLSSAVKNTLDIVTEEVEKTR